MRTIYIIGRRVRVADIVGWIRMDPTCDYPIMQAQDNDYYLYKGFGRSYNINGSIFLSSVNSSDFSDKNSIVYGHNMRNGDMFGDNDYYYEKSYCLEHPYFWIYGENGQYTYRIFDVMRVTDATEAYDTQFASDDDFETYLNDMKNQSSYTIPDAWPSKTVVPHCPLVIGIPVVDKSHSLYRIFCLI